ncbi:MAG TPA: type II secretion system F family protein [Chloroflexota bacterium]|nr:type II secretion system F family protein [Chloroflexota bacterium]
MIPLLLSIALAGGVYLSYEGFARPREQLVATERLVSVREFLVRAGLRGVTPREFALFSVLSAALAVLAAQLFLGWGILSVLAGVIGLLAPYAYYVRRHDRRREQVQAALVEAIEQLRDAIRTGLSVHEALAGLARTGPEALRSEFTLLSREALLLGFDGALAAMRDRLADPLFDVIAAALAINDRLGGRQVTHVLDRLAEAARAQLRIQHEIRAQQGRTVLSARIVAAAPLVALVGLRATNPRYLSIFDSVAGQMVLIGCAVSVALGYAAMLYLTRLPGQRRVLIR